MVGHLFASVEAIHEQHEPAGIVIRFLCSGRGVRMVVEEVSPALQLLSLVSKRILPVISRSWS